MTVDPDGRLDEEALTSFTADLVALAREQQPRLMDTVTGERACIGDDDRLVAPVLELRAEARRRSRAAGYYSGFMPTEVGGGGWSAATQLAVYEALSYGPAHTQVFWPDLVIHVGGQAWGPSGVLLAGDAHIRRSFLDPLVTGELTSCTAITDPLAGSDPQNMHATATRQGDTYRISGVKQFVGNAPYADLLLFYARTSGERGSHRGISLFVVEGDRPGVEIRRIFPVMEGRGNHGEIHLDGCTVPAANLVGEEGMGFTYLMGFISAGRLMMGAQSLGAAQWCLDRAIERAGERTTFGEVLAHRQAIQWMIVDVATDVALLRSHLREAARVLDEGGSGRDETAIAKLVGPRVYSRAADVAMQVHGGSGYLADSTLERHYRRSRGMRLWMGTDEIQRRSLARSLLGVPA